MEARNRVLEARVQELEARLAQNSRNSSKPPSSDWEATPPPSPRTRSLRERSGRKPGGQVGHEGFTLDISANPDHLVRHRVTRCRSCGHGLRAAAPEALVRRQVREIPILRIEITEHQAEVKSCPVCGMESVADFPAEASHKTQIGPGLRALATYLLHGQLLSMERTAEIFSDAFGQGVSEGFLASLTLRASEKLENTEAAIRDALLHSDVAHFDESRMRCEKKGYWLHETGTEALTVYGISEKRGREAMEDMGILPRYKGVSANGRAPFPSHLRAHNAEHARGLQAGSCYMLFGLARICFLFSWAAGLLFCIRITGLGPHSYIHVEGIEFGLGIGFDYINDNYYSFCMRNIFLYLIVFNAWITISHAESLFQKADIAFLSASGDSASSRSNWSDPTLFNKVLADTQLTRLDLYFGSDRPNFSYRSLGIIHVSGDNTISQEYLFSFLKLEALNRGAHAIFDIKLKEESNSKSMTGAAILYLEENQPQTQQYAELKSFKDKIHNDTRWNNLIKNISIPLFLGGFIILGIIYANNPEMAN